MHLCWQLIFLLFNMLSRLVITFLPRSKRVLISWLQSPSTMILEPKGIKICHCFHFFHFLGSRITADGDCSHEIKRHLLLGRKTMTNLKSRDVTLPTKVHVLKVMIFPVVMYGCESWTKKKADRQRINAFELWCWRRLLRVHLTARRSKQ